MSASLVGSEMCIRDRCAPPAHRQLLLSNSSFGIAACLHVQQCGYEVPVSYTHLTLPTICSV
eukprot:4757252-Alexandrium_andersonii.AAC.1